MKLTPIRIRGKRKAPSETPESVGLESTRRLKRSLGTVLARRSMRQRATLESLPVEILETILLYSSNPLLPRASPVIGLRLSGRATLVRFFLWAFHETWDQFFGIPFNDPIDYVHNIRPIEYENIPRGDYTLQVSISCASFRNSRMTAYTGLQGDVLALPWAKIDLMLQAQQTWANRYGQGRWYQHCVPLDRSGSAHGQGGFGHFNARECFEADYQHVKSWPPFADRSLGMCVWNVHPFARMPTDLITGPWDEEKMRRLFWLARGGIRLDGVHQAVPPWELRLQCIDNAIVSAPVPNKLVTNCLMQKWLFGNLPDDLVQKRIISLDRRIEWGGDSTSDKRTLRHMKNILDTLSLSGFDDDDDLWELHHDLWELLG